MELKNKILIIIFTFLFGSVSGQVTKHAFKVEFKNKDIGHIYAIDKIEGKKEIKDLRTNTDVSVLAFSVHVESEVELLKVGGKLKASKCYRHANRGPNDITAHIERLNDSGHYRVTKNEDIYTINKKIGFCVIDLYFSEPLDQTTVFSNMHGTFLKIKEVKPQSYEVETPDGNSTIYSYKDGNLVLIEMKTTLGTVLCEKVI